MNDNFAGVWHSVVEEYMNLLCKKYSRLLIAVLMITVLYGRSVIGMAYDPFSNKYASIADSAEISAEDNENDNENPPKPCKKPCPDMEHGQMVVSLYPLQRRSVNLKDPAHSQTLPILFQKVPTQPPLLLQA